MKTNSHFTTYRLLSLTLAAMLIVGAMAGCGKSSDSAKQSNPPVGTPPPTAEAILTVWEQGNSVGAVQQFLEADWSARPLFAPASVLSLSETQFKALQAGQRETKAAEVQTHITSLRKLAGAVAQAGREAVAKNDVALARRHFTALDQFGNALDRPDSMLIVKLVGQSLKKMAAAEMAKLPQ